MKNAPQRRLFVHLAYLDESDTRSKKHKWQVMSGVLIEDKNFKMTELGVSIVPELLMPADRLSDFEEFHACELYGGYGVFEGIDQAVRFDAIRRLLAMISVGELRVVYGAVDLSRLQDQLYASADPLDIAFRICAKGIEKFEDEKFHELVRSNLGDDIANYSLEKVTPYTVTHLMEELVILIMDECDKKSRDTLQRSFRSLRPKRRDKHEKLSYFHDDMYFGDSRYSVGIQIADLCSYFIARHLDCDEEIEGFYNMIEPYIAFSEIHPKPVEQETTSFSGLRKFFLPDDSRKKEIQHEVPGIPEVLPVNEASPVSPENGNRQETQGMGERESKQEEN